MTTISKIDIDNHVAMARALFVAKAAFSRSMIRLEASLELLSDDEFWNMLPRYRKAVLSSIVGGRDTEASAHNFSCGMELRGEQKAAIYMRFAKTYENISARLYKPLFETVERGDDGYGDLLDSLPLAGRAFHEKAATGYFGNEEALAEGVREGLREAVTESLRCSWSKTEPTDEQIAERLERAVSHIVNGENYNRMALSEKGREVFQWEMSPLECSECNDSISPVRGVDADGKCPDCSLDGDFVERAKEWSCY
jgi:rubrerythrin